MHEEGCYFICLEITRSQNGICLSGFRVGVLRPDWRLTGALMGRLPPAIRSRSFDLPPVLLIAMMLCHACPCSSESELPLRGYRMACCHLTREPLLEVVILPTAISRGHMII